MGRGFSLSRLKTMLVEIPVMSQPNRPSSMQEAVEFALPYIPGLLDANFGPGKQYAFASATWFDYKDRPRYMSAGWRVRLEVS